MANSQCFAPACSISPPKIRRFVENLEVVGSVLTAASDTYPTTKKTSLVCADCDGNGANECSQCKGAGVTSADHFHGQFKAGGLCWLGRGKKEIMYGNCNGPAS